MHPRRLPVSNPCLVNRNKKAISELSNIAFQIVYRKVLIPPAHKNGNVLE